MYEYKNNGYANNPTLSKFAYPANQCIVFKQNSQKNFPTAPQSLAYASLEVE